MRIEVYPAFDGDCLLLNGTGNEGRAQRILVDGGRAGTYSSLAADLSFSYGPASPIDLVVVTHVDADHITGILTLARRAPVGIREIWFNGHGHLRALKRDGTLVPLGPAQGDKLSALIEERGWPWNRSFGSGPVMTGPEPRNWYVWNEPGPGRSPRPGCRRRPGTCRIPDRASRRSAGSIRRTSKRWPPPSKRSIEPW